MRAKTFLAEGGGFREDSFARWTPTGYVARATYAHRVGRGSERARLGAIVLGGRTFTIESSCALLLESKFAFEI